MVISTNTDLSFSPLGDRALLVEVGDHADPETVARIRELADHLARLDLPGVLDFVPALCTIGVHYDPEQWRDESKVRTPYERLVARIQEALPDLESLGVSEGPLREIPVCYEAEFGEDLTALANAHELSIEQVIQIHSGAVYTVYMIGFAPGFAYLGPLDERLALPRRETPRARVPAGSVAVANQYTGIYPADLPGGWHIIGRTPLQLFDSSHDRPSLLSAGDRVQFVPIGAAEFRDLRTGQ
ncbi:MAG: 5-oxoprolinase subunit PxpB [Betaproteobacteria bacterium]|nr:MAG: 5-oxoprolinase subunit PxpB [Betaproteobacteria bacterium]